MRVELSIGCEGQDELLLNSEGSQDDLMQAIIEGVGDIIFSIKDDFISEKFLKGERDGRKIYLKGFWLLDIDDDKQMDDAIDEIVPDDISGLDGFGE